MPKSTISIRIFDYRFVKLYIETMKLIRELFRNEQYVIEFARMVADLLHEGGLVDSKQRENIFVELVWTLSKIQEDYRNRGCRVSIVAKVSAVLANLVLNAFLKKKQQQ